MKKVICMLLICVMLFGIMPSFAANAAETVYLLRDVNEGDYTEVSMAKYETYQTEHFQIFWGTDGANSAKVTQEFLQKCETVLENCWALYIDKMGMEPTSTSVNPNGDKTTEYKTNVILMGTGIEFYDLGANDWGAYGSVDSAGYPYFMCCLAAMDAPTVVAHEFGHAVHYAQGDNAWKDNIFLGPWFEAVANWFAEQYIYEYMPGRTQLSHLYLRESSLTYMNGRGYYEAWPILQYLTEDPDNTGVYGEKFVQKLLSTNLGNTNVLFWEVLESANGSFTTADTVGLYASHTATMDFRNKALYNRYINNFCNGGYFYWQQRYTVPEKLGREENTYAVPPERAPQGMGYNIIPLDFTEGEVKVTLNPLTDIEGADWRARLVKESNGVTSYSELFKAGETMSISVDDADELYLSVAATPSLDTMSRHTITGWAEHSRESNFPYENKKQYPYSITLENASPLKRPEVPTANMHRHPNGGGLVANTASAASTAYVGQNAMVLGYASVTDNAIIDGNAIVAGNAKVTGNAYVGDDAVIFDRAQVGGNARVIESACLYVDYVVSGNAVVKGQALGLYNGGATGESIIYGDWYEDEGRFVSGGRFSGWHSITTDEGYAEKRGDYYVRSYITGLRSSYEFDGNLKDTYGYTDLYGVNNPKIGAGSVEFDGKSYLALDSSVLCYNDMKIALSAEGKGEVLNIGEKIILTLSDDVTLSLDGQSISLPAAEGENGVEIKFEDGKATLTANGGKKSIYSSVTPLTAAREGVNTVGYGFVGSMNYMRIFEVLESEMDYDRLYLVLDAEGSTETGTLDSKRDTSSSIWRGWSAGNSGVRVDGGLNISGNVTASIKSPSYKANLFVLEFTPSGGNTYPDHGISDIDGDVLFAHRFASDADTIYVGRGEINAGIRGTNYVTDSASQQRLSNFVCEKLGGMSARGDRGAAKYGAGIKMRIVAENTVWTEEDAEKFSLSENYTENLSAMVPGEKVYKVTYYLEEDGLVYDISESVYKGSFEGFGGIRTAGGTNGASVSYKDLKIYTDNKNPKVSCKNSTVSVSGLEGDAVAVFAAKDGGFRVYTERVNGDFTLPLPEGFETSRFMLFDSLERLNPLIKAYDINAK